MSPDSFTQFFLLYELEAEITHWSEEAEAKKKKKKKRPQQDSLEQLRNQSGEMV